MKNLSQALNMKFGVVADAHIMNNVNIGLNAYETLSFICSEKNIDLSDVSDADFDSAAIILADFCKSANEDAGFAVSVWFDR